MGNNTAMDLATNLDISLENAIGIHLQSNHYPPVPLSMVQPCIDAIDAYYDEDYQRMIDMPMVGDFQITYRGSTQAPASAIISQHHLEFWLPEEDY